MNDDQQDISDTEVSDERAIKLFDDAYENLKVISNKTENGENQNIISFLKSIKIICKLCARYQIKDQNVDDAILKIVDDIDQHGKKLEENESIPIKYPLNQIFNDSHIQLLKLKRIIENEIYSRGPRRKIDLVIYPLIFVGLGLVIYYLVSNIEFF